MVWQVTHYLCRYPPVAGSFSPFSPRLSLSVSGWIKSLSHEGLAEIIQVSQGRVEGEWRYHSTVVAKVIVNLMGLRLWRGRGGAGGRPVVSFTHWLCG